MRVLVTGSASRLAAVLLPRLAADERVKQIIGVDRRETAFRDPRYTQVLLDTRSAELAAVLKRVDAVVHLGLSRHGPERRAGNVEGTQNLARLAQAQGVRRLVWLSSIAVYELPPRARVLTESHPRRAWSGLDYAADCVEIEAWLDQFDQDRERLTIVRLRPHLIVGPHMPPFARAALGAPFYIPFTDRPRLQCVHEDDVVQAIVAALYQDVRGAFNLACTDSATLAEIKRMRHRALLPLAFPLARALTRVGARLGTGVDAAWIEALRYNLVLDTSRARKQLNWRPRRDTIAACLAAIKETSHG